MSFRYRKDRCSANTNTNSQQNANRQQQVSLNWTEFIWKQRLSAMNLNCCLILILFFLFTFFKPILTNCRFLCRYYTKHRLKSGSLSLRVSSAQPSPCANSDLISDIWGSGTTQVSSVDVQRFLRARRLQETMTHSEGWALLRGIWLSESQFTLTPHHAKKLHLGT